MRVNVHKVWAKHWQELTLLPYGISVQTNVQISILMQCSIIDSRGGYSYFMHLTFWLCFLYDVVATLTFLPVMCYDIAYLNDHQFDYSVFYCLVSYIRRPSHGLRKFLTIEWSTALRPELILCNLLFLYNVDSGVLIMQTCLAIILYLFWCSGPNQ